MAKKKKEKRSNQASGLADALGVKNILSNEILWIFVGFIIIALAVYMLIAFISYLSTGAADQTMIVLFRTVFVPDTAVPDPAWRAPDQSLPREPAEMVYVDDDHHGLGFCNFR